MKKNSASRTWTPTRYKHLYKHNSGIYYARLRIDGKATWRSLGTKLLSVAQAELADLLDQEKLRSELTQSGRKKLGHRR